MLKRLVQSVLIAATYCEMHKNKMDSRKKERDTWKCSWIC